MPLPELSSLSPATREALMKALEERNSARTSKDKPKINKAAVPLTLGLVGILPVACSAPAAKPTPIVSPVPEGTPVPNLPTPEASQSTRVIAQFEANGQKETILLANLLKEGKPSEQYFLVKPDNQLLSLSGKVAGLNWGFDQSKAVWKDTKGLVFGSVTPAPEVKDWSVKLEDYGVVSGGGLPIPGQPNLSEGQPLLVQVTKDGSGSVNGIKAQVSPGFWVEVSPKHFSRIKLTDQALAHAKLFVPPTPEPTPTPKPTPEAPAPAKLATYLGETDFATLPPTKGNAEFIFRGQGGVWGQPGAIGRKNISRYDLPNGEQTLKDIVLGKPTGTRVWDLRGFFFEAERVYNIGDVDAASGAKVFIIEFKAVNDQGKEVKVKLKMASQKVWSDMGFGPRFYEVSSARAEAGMVRPGDVAGFSYGPLIVDSINNAKNGEVIIDATIGPAAGEALVVIPKRNPPDTLR